MRVTLRSVASLANVHYSTVSHVLNGAHTNTRVSEETRERIINAANTLGYQVNRVAQQLKTNRSYCVGVLCGDLENAFFARFVTLCARALETKGYEMILSTRNEERDEDLHLLNTLASRQPDGLIIWGEISLEVRSRLTSSDLTKSVVVGYYHPGIDSIAVDLGSGFRIALDHLYAQGITDIGYIAPASLPYLTGDNRLKEYNMWMKEHSLNPKVFTFGRISHEGSSVRGLTQKLIKSGTIPRALICFNDMVALGVLSGLGRSGLKVPEDVLVIGCDDLPIMSELTVPVTSIHYPLEEVAQIAVELLMDRITFAGETLIEPRCKSVEAVLKIRESSIVPS